MNLLSVSLATEGDIDEQALRQLLAQSGRPFSADICYGKHGRDHLIQNLPRFNQAARTVPFIILADLEQDPCVIDSLADWLPNGKNPNLVLRVAVRMIESWLLADRDAIAGFLGVPLNRIPLQPDLEIHPKRLIVQIARHSHKSKIKQDLVPAPTSTSQVGPNYSGQMIRFILDSWQAHRAIEHSPSLERALRAVQSFTPQFD